MAWGKRDDTDLIRLYKKAGGKAAMLKRLDSALKNMPRHAGRKKGAVKYRDDEIVPVLRQMCEELDRLYGIKPYTTVRWFAGTRERAREALAKRGVKLDPAWPPIMGNSPEAIAARLARKIKKRPVDI